MNIEQRCVITDVVWLYNEIVMLCKVIYTDLNLKL